uniref:Ribonuclease A-domain domain-containing protein n=1 Tax=Oreochromis niloticus TaxID=8128 RepID=I3KXZ0_ORENI
MRIMFAGLLLVLILFACLLLVLLFATGLSKLANHQLKWPQKETPYEKFIRQHVDAKMNVEKCDEEIRNKKIYKKKGICKKTNTFILSNDEQVKAICNGRGSPYNTSLTMSNETFSIVICQLKNGDRKSNCEYNGTLHCNRRVVVTCKNELPVHYGGDIMTFESNNAAIGKIPMHSNSVPTNIHV